MLFIWFQIIVIESKKHLCINLCVGLKLEGKGGVIETPYASPCPCP
jgi:hypothetical protein